jgi:hypothetical protein
MNENLLQRSVFYAPNAPQATVEEVKNWQREQEECQREWKKEKECRLKESLNLAFVAERQLHDPRYIRGHTDRQLRDLSKRIKSSIRALSEQYRSEFGNDLLSVFLEDCETETSPAFSRDIRNPARRDKRRMNNLRKRARRLEILTQRGETSALGQGITKTGALTTVVAAT